MAFLTIHPAAGLSPAQRRRVSRNGPVAVAASRPHAEMLHSAGFMDVTEIDCTADFARVTRAWIDQWDANRPEMEAIWGSDGVAERQRERRSWLRATQDGILRRSLFTARRP